MPLTVQRGISSSAVRFVLAASAMAMTSIAMLALAAADESHSFSPSGTVTANPDTASADIRREMFVTNASYVP
jgi:hypothetical protein